VFYNNDAQFAKVFTVSLVYGAALWRIRLKRVKLGQKLTLCSKV